MAKKVQRGGEAEPDGPRKDDESEGRPQRGSPEKPADRDEGNVTRRTPGKAEGT
jgi:hypothetical protein